MKKTVYSLGDLAGILFACNRRYLAHLSALDDFSAGVKLLDRVTRPRKVEGKTVKGIDFFNPMERTLLRALQNPKFNIVGVRRADLAPLLDKISPPHAALTADAAATTPRPHQTRRQNLPLLPHLRRTRRYRCSIPHHRIRRHSSARLIDSLQKMTRVGW